MQQVTVVQAWQSMKQGDDTQKQNVTLLVFTVVTVVFVSWRVSLLLSTNSIPERSILTSTKWLTSYQCHSYQVYSA